MKLFYMIPALFVFWVDVSCAKTNGPQVLPIDFFAKITRADGKFWLEIEIKNTSDSTVFLNKKAIFHPALTAYVSRNLGDGKGEISRIASPVVTMHSHQDLHEYLLLEELKKNGDIDFLSARKNIKYRVNVSDIISPLCEKLSENERLYVGFVLDEILIGSGEKLSALDNTYFKKRYSLPLQSMDSIIKETRSAVADSEE